MVRKRFRSVIFDIAIYNSYDIIFPRLNLGDTEKVLLVTDTLSFAHRLNYVPEVVQRSKGSKVTSIEICINIERSNIRAQCLLLVVSKYK